MFLDVGANEGRFSKHMRTAGYGGRLISFEPIPAECRKVERLAEGDPEWNVCCYALGDDTTQREFKINLTQGTKTVFSSFRQVKDGVDCLSESIPVKVYRLDDVLPSLISDIRRPRVFLKMDTQGFDRDVFDGAVNSMQSIVGLQSELSVIHLYDGVPHFTKNIEHYESFGFELMNLFVVSRSGDGRVAEYDCVMAKAGT